jgi:hypothetical protein
MDWMKTMMEMIVFIDTNQCDKKILHDRKPKGKSVNEMEKKLELLPK